MLCFFQKSQDVLAVIRLIEIILMGQRNIGRIRTGAGEVPVCGNPLFPLVYLHLQMIFFSKPFNMFIRR